jgi:cell division transport system permease protein
MPARIFKKYKYDISLQDGIGAHLVTWVTGLMVFFMTLMLAINIGLAAMADSWVSGLAGSLTVEIKPPVSADGSARPTGAQVKQFNDNADKIIWLSKQHPAVTEGRRLSDAEIKTLIAPFLGGTIPEDLPLPALIDLKLATDADTAKLQTDILELVPSATIDSHADTLDDVRTLISTVRGFVFLLTGVVMLLAIVAISGIVRSKFSIHRGEAEILHLLGAPDEYIARQFRHHTLQGTLKGAIGGVTCMVITLLVISGATSGISETMLPQLDFAAWHWAVLTVVPVVAGAVVAHITAQMTVMRSIASFE